MLGRHPSGLMGCRPSENGTEIGMQRNQKMRLAILNLLLVIAGDGTPPRVFAAQASATAYTEANSVSLDDLDGRTNRFFTRTESPLRISITPYSERVPPLEVRTGGDQEGTAASSALQRSTRRVPYGVRCSR